MELSNETYLDDKKSIVNFEKLTMISKEHIEFQAFQQQKYSFTRISEIYDYIVNSEVLDQDDLFERSKFIEVIFSFIFFIFYLRFLLIYFNLKDFNKTAESTSNIDKFLKKTQRLSKLHS